MATVVRFVMEGVRFVVGVCTVVRCVVSLGTVVWFGVEVCTVVGVGSVV